MSARKAGVPIAGLRLLTSASDILEAEDIVREEVSTPEWGEGTGVLVQSMTADQRFVYGQAGLIVTRTPRGLMHAEANQEWNATVALVVCSVVNEQGEPVFSSEHVEALARKNSAPVNRIADVARRLSYLRAEDMEDLSDGLKATNGASHSG